MLLTPYLNFRGQAEEAMGLYQRVFGGELTVLRFAEMGGMGVPEAEQRQVMHSQLSAPIGTLMGSDIPSTMDAPTPVGVTVSLSGGPDDAETLRGYWDGLAEGATITAPIGVAPWGDTFGMLDDRFGVTWLVNIGQQDAGQ